MNTVPWASIPTLQPFKLDSRYLFWMNEVSSPKIFIGSELTGKTLVMLDGCFGYEIISPHSLPDSFKMSPKKAAYVMKDNEDPVYVSQAPAAPEVVTVFTDDQKQALSKLRLWLAIPKEKLNGTNRGFVLKGVAGSGKTFLLKQLIKENPHFDWHLTAPTNKAAKEIEKATGMAAGTIHSKLGLVMKAGDSEKMVLTDANKPMPFYDKSIVVVDESSMNNEQLVDFIWSKTGPRFGYNLRVIFMGDPAQLPPVGEKKTKSWSLAAKENSVNMKEVKRFDNQLLTLSVRIREQMRAKDFSNPILDDHDEDGGVFVLNNKSFERHILDNASIDRFTNHKVLAWRNRTVNSWNDKIRKELGFNDDYNVGDLVLMASMMTFEEKSIHVDDEFKILHADQDDVKVHDRVIPSWILKAKNDELTVTLKVPVDIRDLDDYLAKLASDARRAKGYEVRLGWEKFWKLKETFQTLRFAYAMTTHRSQGSTYDGVYVDTVDTLANPEKMESLKCLYVESTRPRTHLWSNA